MSDDHNDAERAHNEFVLRLMAAKRGLFTPSPEVEPAAADPSPPPPQVKNRALLEAVGVPVDPAPPGGPVDFDAGARPGPPTPRPFTATDLWLAGGEFDPDAEFIPIIER